MTKWQNALAAYTDQVPVKHKAKLAKVTFEELQSNIWVYLLPLRRFIEGRDAYMLLALAGTAFPEEGLDRLYEKMSSEQQDKLWRYLKFFVDWADEYNHRV